MKEAIINQSIKKGFISGDLLYKELLEEWYEENAFNMWMSLLQKWLRDSKNIHVGVFQNWGFLIEEIKLNEYNNPLETNNSAGETYEEALEAGLIKALSLI